MAAMFWLVYFVLSTCTVFGQGPETGHYNSERSKDDGGKNITPFQLLGNLRPTEGRTNFNFQNVGPYYDGIGHQAQSPDLLPVKPLTLHTDESQPVIRDGPQIFQSNENYGPGPQPTSYGGNDIYEPVNTYDSNNYGGDNSYEPFRSVSGNGPDASYSGGYNVYEPGFGHNIPERKLIGYKTVLEQRRVAVISNKQVPVVRIKHVIEKIPGIKMVNQVVKRPKHSRH